MDPFGGSAMPGEVDEVQQVILREEGSMAEEGRVRWIVRELDHQRDSTDGRRRRVRPMNRVWKPMFSQPRGQLDPAVAVEHARPALRACEFGDAFFGSVGVGRPAACFAETACPAVVDLSGRTPQQCSSVQHSHEVAVQHQRIPIVWRFQRLLQQQQRLHQARLPRAVPPGEKRQRAESRLPSRRGST